MPKLKGCMYKSPSQVFGMHVGYNKLPWYIDYCIFITVSIIIIIVKDTKNYILLLES